MRADLISAAPTTLYFGKDPFVVHNCLSLLDPRANSPLSKAFVNINQQSLSAGSRASKTRREMTSLARSCAEPSQAPARNPGLGVPAPSPGGWRAAAAASPAPENAASTAWPRHRGTAAAPLPRTQRSPARFPSCLSHYFKGCCHTRGQRRQLPPSFKLPKSPGLSQGGS